MYTNTGELTVKVLELTELVHVPQVNRTLNEKVQGWLEQKGEDPIDKYDKLRSKYSDLLYIRRVSDFYKENPGNIPPKPPVHWFELLQCGPMKWDIYNMMPTAEYSYETLPRDIIDRVSEALVDPEKVVTMKGVRSKSTNKTVDLQFVCLSSTYIVGTVTETSRSRKLWEDDLSTAYEIYYGYKKKYPEEITAFTDEFVTRIDPDWTGLIPAPAEPPHTGQWEVGTPHPPQQTPDNGNDIDINMVISLASDPEFNKWLWLKLEELKNTFKADIDAYRTAKAHYRETLLADRKIEEGKRPPYWFEITLQEPFKWLVTKLEPRPRVFESRYETISPLIFNLMLNTVTNPGTVMSISSELPHPMNLKVDAQWVRYSSNCLFGKIHETAINGTSIPERCIPSAQYMSIMQQLALFQRLDQHMYHSREVVKSYIEEFMVKLYPILQEKNIKEAKGRAVG
jgi:hypothetical protein